LVYQDRLNFFVIIGSEKKMGFGEEKAHWILKKCYGCLINQQSNERIQQLKASLLLKIIREKRITGPIAGIVVTQGVFPQQQRESVACFPLPEILTLPVMPCCKMIS